MKFSYFEKILKKSLLYDLKIIDIILQNLDKEVVIDFVSKTKNERKKLIEKIERNIDN